MLRLSSGVALLLLAGGLTGCSQGPKTAPTAKADGAVTVDGKAMADGEVRFSIPGQPVKSLEVKDGSFSGDVFVGKNRVEVVSDKEVPNPGMPGTKMKVNTIADKFTGPTSALNEDIPKEGKSGLKFDVMSARK